MKKKQVNKYIIEKNFAVLLDYTYNCILLKNISRQLSSLFNFK